MVFFVTLLQRFTCYNTIETISIGQQEDENGLDGD